MTNPLLLILSDIVLITLSILACVAVGTIAYIVLELLGAVRIGRAEYRHLRTFYDQQQGDNPQCYTKASGRTPYPAEEPDKREIVRDEMRREWRRWTRKETE